MAVRDCGVKTKEVKGMQKITSRMLAREVERQKLCRQSQPDGNLVDVILAARQFSPEVEDYILMVHGIRKEVRA